MNIGDLEKLLARLAAKRPVFHSEADFQHALAWEFQLMHQNAEVRLEVPTARQNDKRASIDLQVKNVSDTILGELKYKTAKAALDLNGEFFRLKQQGAQDQGKYDFIKDIARLEEFTYGKPSMTGFAILLTNDPSYWNERRKADPIDAAFALTEGRELTGTLAWASHASAGSTKGREMPVKLRERYVAEWRDYAAASLTGGSQFRYLAFRVSKQQ